MFILFDLSALAFFLALIFTPVVRRLALRFDLVDKPDNQRKLHKNPVPRLGGVAIALSYAFALAFCLIAPYKNISIDIPTGLASGIRLLPAAITIFAVGLFDDLWGLKPWQKLAGQAVGAIIAYNAGFGVYTLQGDVLPLWLSIPVTVVWLVGCSNALNLIDGMDGLAAGVGFFSAMTTLVAALTNGNIELALVTAPLVGSLMGFLRYNFNPASIFLGDCGSLLIGFLLGCFGAMWSHKSATILGMTAPLMALAIPLLEVGISIVRRFIRKQPIFGADRGHIHHRLLAQGFTPRRAVVLIYGICGLAALFSLLQDVMQNRVGGLVVVCFCFAAWIGVQRLGYDEFGAAHKVIMRGQLRGLIDTHLRIRSFENALDSADSLESIARVIHSGAIDFGFDGVVLCLRGQHLELTTPHGNECKWQLRIQFPGKQYVNVETRMGSSIHPAILSLFAQSIERSLGRKPFLMFGTPSISEKATRG